MTKFYSSVIASAVAYVFKWFPLHEALIKDSQFVNFSKKGECDFSVVCAIIERYPKLLSFTDKELDKVGE